MMDYEQVDPEREAKEILDASRALRNMLSHVWEGQENPLSITIKVIAKKDEASASRAIYSLVIHLSGETKHMNELTEALAEQGCGCSSQPGGITKCEYIFEDDKLYIL